MEKKIGFIGLGEMGKWMARNVARAGFDLTVFDMNPDAVKFVTDHGAKAAASAVDLAERTEWIFLSLPNTAVVEEVIFGDKGLIHGAGTGSLIVDCGTTGYLQTMDFERRLRRERDPFCRRPCFRYGGKGKGRDINGDVRGSEGCL